MHVAIAQSEKKKKKVCKYMSTKEDMYCMCLISKFIMTVLNMHFVGMDVLSLLLSACSDI